MGIAGEVELLEVLVGLDKGPDHLQGRGRIYIVIDLTVDKQELALKQMRIVHIGIFGVPWTDRISHPLLVPPYLVHTVVMAAAKGHSYLVELGIEQKGSKSALAAGRVAVHTHVGYVHMLVFLAAACIHRIRSG